MSDCQSHEVSFSAVIAIVLGSGRGGILPSLRHKGGLVAGNPRASEGRVFRRLMRLHPLLTGGELLHFDEKNLDGIILSAGRRYGFQLTEIFAEGVADPDGGSTAARCQREWRDIGPALQSALDAMPVLNRASISIWFRKTSRYHHLHPNDLPRKAERSAFVAALAGYIASAALVVDRTSYDGHSFKPEGGDSIVAKYVEEVHLGWRTTHEDALPIVQVVGLNHWLRMGADVIGEAIERKLPSLTRAARGALDQRHQLDELYLVLGGDPEGPRFTRQISGDHPQLQHCLTYMRPVLDDVGFEGIVIFHDAGDAVSVFCTGCIRNDQVTKNWRSRSAGLQSVDHSCASLTLKGPTMMVVDENGSAIPRSEP